MNLSWSVGVAVRRWTAMLLALTVWHAAVAQDMEFAVVGPQAAGALNGAAMAFVVEARVTGNKVFQAHAA